MTIGLIAGMASVIVVAGTVTGAVAAEPAAQTQAAVQAILDATAGAWNAGDLDRFMTSYEPAPTTTYVNASRFVVGYDAIRAMYAGPFSGGGAAMGRLSLEIIDFRQLGDDHAYVVGRFHLHRDAAHGGDVSGPTTLLFKRSSAGWRIIADHS